MRLILADSQVVIFNQHEIDMFDHLLHITRTYYIHNAIVKAIKPEHRIVDNVYHWTINPTTLIEEISNDDLSLSAPSFSFVSFTEFHKLMDDSALADVIAVAIDVCPARQLQTRNGSSMIQDVIRIDQLEDCHKEDISTATIRR